MGRIDGGKGKIDLKFLDDISESEREVLEYFSGIEIVSEEILKSRRRIFSPIIGLKIDNGHIEKFISSGGNISSLPENFENLKFLQNLDLTHNKLTHLPENFGNLKSLEILDLFDTNLTSLPESFGNLESLKLLNLGANSLIFLPESFGNLKILQNLDLSLNKLTTLPENFGNLKSLKNFKFS